MRHLIIHRERSLVGFALNYYCVLGQDRDAFLQELPERNASARRGVASDYPLRNGQTVSIDIGNDALSFFIAVYLDGRSIVTAPISIAAGSDDAVFAILTQAVPYKGMEIAVVPVTQFHP